MKYLKIEECENNNGLYYGVTLFVSGCQHHCKDCFNKASWNKNAGTDFTEETLQKLFEILERPQIKRITFSGGDPLARFNRNKILYIAKRIKTHFAGRKRILIWCYTGYLLNDFAGGGESWGIEDWGVINGFLTEGGGDTRKPETDAQNGFFKYFSEYFDFIVDGKYKSEASHNLPYRGSDNQKIYHNINGRWEEW